MSVRLVQHYPEAADLGTFDDEAAAIAKADELRAAARAAGTPYGKLPRMLIRFMHQAPWSPARPAR